MDVIVDLVWGNLNVVRDLFLGRLLAWWLHPKGVPKPENVKGKVYLVTGCTGGIGAETVKRLLVSGATVLMACRKKDAAQALLDRWDEEYPEKELKHRAKIFHVDMLSLASVESFCDEILAVVGRIDVIINNAGLFAMVAERAESDDGFEKHFQVNYLSPLVISSRLVDLLAKSTDPRIINVATLMHRYVKLNIDDWQLEKNYAPHSAYGISKLLMVASTIEMQSKLAKSGAYQHIKVYSLHPGTIATDIARDLNPVIQFLYKYLVGHLLMSIPQGADTQLYLATDPQIPKQYVSGEYFVHCQEAPRNAQAEDPALRAAIWRKTEQAIGKTLLQEKSHLLQDGSS